MTAKGEGPAQKAIEAFGGIDAICARLEDGKGYRAVAAEIGVSRSALDEWIGAEPGRSARAHASLDASADACDEEALAVLQDESMEVSRAREIASHLRWRAKVRSPRRYGDKVQVDANVNVSNETDEALAKRAAALAAKLGIAAPGGEGD